MNSLPMKIYLAVSFVLIIVLFSFLIFFRNFATESIIGFLGVVVGSTIAGAVQLVVSLSDAKQQFRLAALDKRLQAHQEAFSLMERLYIPYPNKDDPYQIVSECKDWWKNNCLFLTPEASDAFKKAYIKQEWCLQPLEKLDGFDSRKDAMNAIKYAREMLVKGVNLPPIGEEEEKQKE